ncbi:uncharacterized protein LOC130816052 isoform X2 [Amaranthus tricolor]|uniref:uncharacterized protein LOC130816052 isoform X2 n=1 Tax=Amaranthus tricolor TaxID=29722 RepID=UPI00258311C7|nr:uncharacterized protein LOC130816052 isoform X2 [Amaranthus tricolor]
MLFFSSFDQKDRKGECCIARWGGGGHMSAGGYSTSKMDMIMLKFRPIAPKPVAGTTTVSGGSSDSSKGGGGSGSGRGRRKSSNNNNKRCTSSINNAPDLSPSNYNHQVNNNIGDEQQWVKFDKNCYGSTLYFEDNYNNCHGSVW